VTIVIRDRPACHFSSSPQVWSFDLRAAAFSKMQLKLVGQLEPAVFEVKMYIGHWKSFPFFERGSFVCRSGQAVMQGARHLKVYLRALMSLMTRISAPIALISEESSNRCDAGPLNL
jgi:hypothetical protein